MKSPGALIISLFIVSGSQNTALYAQSAFIPDEKVRRLCTFETSTFSSDIPGKTYLEVLTHTSVQNLQFRKLDSQFIASYRLSVTVEDTRTSAQLAKTFIDTIRVATFKATSFPKPPRVVRFGFLLRPGNYLVRMMLYDEETERTLAIKRELEIPYYDASQMQLSDLVLADTVIDEATNAESGALIPNIHKIFVSGIDTLFLYAELYGLGDDYGSPLTELRLQIIDCRGKTVRMQRTSVGQTPPIVAIQSKFLLQKLPAGHYSAQVRASRGTIVIEKKETFLVIDETTIGKKYATLVENHFGERSFF